MKNKIIIILFFFLMAGNFLYGQSWIVEKNEFENNWDVTLQVGRTALLGELNKDFSGFSNDMNNLSDWGFNFQIAKMVWKRFDIGCEFGFSNYKGYKNYSANVNWLMLHKRFNSGTKDFQPYPIYYDSDLADITLFFKYNFINFCSLSKGYLNLNLYLKVGVGVASPSVELGYKDMASYELTGLTHPLYLKGRYPNTSRDQHTFFSPAFGMNYQLSGRIFLSAEASFQFVGADNLDGIHNYNDKLTPDVPDELDREYKIRVYDLTAKFLCGITYFFNFDIHKQFRKKYIPWFKNQYRSYYSKFQKKSSKRARQERLPFYKNKFQNE